MAVNDIVMGAAGASGPATYIEDVFSTWLYTGNGATQTITNGIDLSGKGGLTWIKARSTTYPHVLVDTSRGATKTLMSNGNYAEQTATSSLTAFNSTGFSLGNDSDVNFNNATYASWTFRKQPKFFDIVTYTGNGATTRQINHNLGSVPGCIIVKCTNAAEFWAVYHRGTDASAPQDYRLKLNATEARAASSVWRNTAPTSTNFTVDQGGEVNASGQTYVAYLFAHDAGGFGLTGTDNVISCGSYTGSSTVDVDVNLGYEPQFVMIKNITTGSTDWYIADIMRGMALTGIQPLLAPNLSGAETGFSGTYFTPTATGMKVQYGSGTAICSAGNNYIYIAIRRGPMKIPTTGTEVYNAIVRNGTNAVANVTGVGFSPDLVTVKNRNAGYDNNWVDKLRGALPILASSKTGAEVTDTTTAVTAFGQDGVTLGDNNIGTYGGSVNFFTANSYVNWFFKRAPGFFDVVCYTGTGTAGATVTHNLTVTPELAIFKNRTTTGYNWVVKTTATFGTNSYLVLEGASSTLTHVAYGATATASQLTLSTGGSNAGDWNQSGGNIVAYLFATVAGVSKVGSYTGNGSSQTINCGFTTGARFFLVKATSTTGNWWVYDSSRGIISSNDPALALNSTAAEITSADAVDADSSGIIVNQEATCSINASGVSYIFLSIA